MGTLTCTKCGASLKTKAPVAPGKKMKCPKCEEVFVVEDKEEEKKTVVGNKSAASDEGDDEKEHESSKRRIAKKRQQHDDEKSDEQEDDEPPKKKGKAAKKGGTSGKSSKGSPILLLIGVGVLLLLCLVGGGGAAGWFFLMRDTGGKKDPLVKGNGDSIGKPSTDKKPPPADFVVTAESITQEQVADINAYKAKYKNKILEVTGEVSSVAVDKIYLKGIPNPKINWFKTVNCEIPTKDWDRSHLLAPGQKVKFTGKTEAFFTEFVELSFCSFVELESVKLPKVSAEEIAKALHGGDINIAAAAGPRWARVTGVVEVMPRSPNMDYQHRMYLNLQTKTRLVLVIEVPRSITLPAKGQTIEFRTTSGFFHQAFDKEFQLPGILLSVK